MTRTLGEIGEKFHAAAKQVAHAQWRGIPEDATGLVAREARAADLVIIGRKHRAQTHYYDLDPGVTIVRVGRPVLLVPDGIDSLDPRRIVVAWKDTRESRRAVRDAIPLLSRRAHEVMIVEICEHGADGGRQPGT